MALSDYELKVLQQMEAQLSDQDPQLADRMRTSAKPTGLGSRPRQVALGIVLLLLGATSLLTGMFLTPALENLQVIGTAVGVLGFVLMVLGVLTIFGVAFSRQTALKSAPAQRSATKTSGEKSSFMQRQTDKWNRREQQ